MHMRINSSESSKLKVEHSGADSEMSLKISQLKKGKKKKEKKEEVLHGPKLLKLSIHIIPVRDGIKCV